MGLISRYHEWRLDKLKKETNNNPIEFLQRAIKTNKSNLTYFLKQELKGIPKSEMKTKLDERIKKLNLDLSVAKDMKTIKDGNLVSFEQIFKANVESTDKILSEFSNKLNEVILINEKFKSGQLTKSINGKDNVTNLEHLIKFNIQNNNYDNINELVNGIVEHRQLISKLESKELAPETEVNVDEYMFKLKDNNWEYTPTLKNLAEKPFKKLHKLIETLKSNDNNNFFPTVIEKLNNIEKIAKDIEPKVLESEINGINQLLIQFKGTEGEAKDTPIQLNLKNIQEIFNNNKVINNEYFLIPDIFKPKKSSQ